MGVLAETVRTWLEIVNLRRQRQLAGGIVELLQDRESLAESRYDRGLTDASGPRAARQSLRNAQASCRRSRPLLAEAEGRLWVLLGGYRAELAGYCPIHRPPPRRWNRYRPAFRRISWCSGPTSGRHDNASRRPGTPSAPPRGAAAETVAARFHRGAERRGR